MPSNHSHHPAMPPTSRVQVRSLSRHPAKHATKPLTSCHATNTKSANDAIEQTSC
ncbi:hypothetical protein M404DRAFT_1004338 [Pisolithus tinctorius Marx 270]|uniref:Uncharacterized protein n=1 Tax=Pisolithus tinctorius Marx 270 TaxID=870435 RepID=A0A0C3ISH1_PISTI|nr:hypothetical protein M404DRAFT_1004338 [Pisolithus tinctorius Marx 270]